MSLCCICLLCKNTTDATERTLNELPPLHEVEQLNQPGENTFAWAVVRENERNGKTHTRNLSLCSKNLMVEPDLDNC